MQEKITKKIFAQNLGNLMEKFGATQEMLSNDLGIAQSAISNYLKGRVPRAEILFELANYFGISVQELLGTNPLSAQVTLGNRAGNVSTMLIDLRGDLAAAEIAIKDAEDKLKQTQVGLKNAKDAIGVAKIEAEQLDSIRRKNSK